MSTENLIEPVNESVTPKKKNNFRTFIIILIVFFAIWFSVKPGVFTIQPIGALPEGITIVYHSRNPEMPFFFFTRWTVYSNTRFGFFIM